MEFKTLGERDTALIAEIARISWYDTYLPILEEAQLVYMLEALYTHEALVRQMNEGQKFTGLVNEGVVSGFSAYSPAGEDRFKLNKIYLLPSAQGGGRGKALLHHAEDLVRAEGGKVMTLNVNRHNKAKFFYEKQGYVVIKEEDIPVGPYFMNDYVLEKAL